VVNTRDTRRLLLSLFILSATVCSETTMGANDNSDSYVQTGYAIAPVPLNLQGKNPALVGLGSYNVNTSGCHDCHTWGPNGNWAVGGNPFLGQPKVIDPAYYLADGRSFGPGVVSANLTPDENGLPAGLTLSEFISVFRTGRDPDNPARILQAMPWPLLGQMTDRDLESIYEYLRAIPSLPGNR